MNLYFTSSKGMEKLRPYVIVLAESKDRAIKLIQDLLDKKQGRLHGFEEEDLNEVPVQEGVLSFISNSELHDEVCSKPNGRGIL